MLAARILALVALLSSAAAWAAEPRQSQREQDRAACVSQPAQDQAACLREAAAARQEARRGRLDEGQPAEYEKNRLARCSYLPVADRADCERRMRGEGTTSGSVAGGGIYRELRTLVPADEQPAPASGASSGAGSQK